MTQFLFDLTPLQTHNLASACTKNYYISMKSKIVAEVELMGLSQSEDPESDYNKALTEKNVVAAAFYATDTEEPELLLIDAINDYSIELVFALLALGVDVNYQYVGQDNDINYPITLAMGWHDKTLFNLLLLHPNVNLYVLGESLDKEHDMRKALGYEYKNVPRSPLIQLLNPQYYELFSILAPKVNVEFDNYQTLSELLLARGNMQEIVSFVQQGGRLIDADEYPEIQSAYYAYIADQNTQSKNRLLLFKPLIETCFAYEESHWLADLITNIDEGAQQKVAHLLGIEEALLQLSAELKETPISPEINSVVLTQYPEVKVDITLDVKAHDPWSLPPFIQQVFIKQTQDGTLQFQIKNDIDKSFVFDLPNMLEKGCATELMFSVFVHHNLTEISRKISNTIYENSKDVNSLGISYMLKLLDLMSQGLVSVVNDIDDGFKRLLLMPFERDIESMEEFKFFLSKQGIQQPKFIVEILNSKVTLVYINQSDNSYSIVCTYDFYNQQAQTQAYALTVSNIWKLAGKS